MAARFDSPESLQRGGSARHRALIAEGEPLVQGNGSYNLRAIRQQYDTPQSTTEVIVTDIKPGRESEYRAWFERIQKAQETFPGYLGSFAQPPHQKERGWTTVLWFDTAEHLDGWPDSPARAALLVEGEPLVHGFARSASKRPFPAGRRTTRPPANLRTCGKTASLVLLTLFRS